eukprot:jgi/Mesvir1/6850/Mv09023-RA.1
MMRSSERRGKPNRCRNCAPFAAALLGLAWLLYVVNNPPPSREGLSIAHLVDSPKLLDKPGWLESRTQSARSAARNAARQQAAHNDTVLAGLTACIVVSPSDLDVTEYFINGLATLVQSLSAQYASVTVLVATHAKDRFSTSSASGAGGDEQDNNVEDNVVWFVDTAMDTLQGGMFGASGQGGGRKHVTSQWLPEPDVLLDVSAPMKLTLSVMDVLIKASPPFSVVHFTSPQLAYAAALIRYQNLALEHTAIIVHYRTTLGATRRALALEVSSLEDIESEFLEAMAAPLADIVVCEMDQARDALALAIHDNVPGVGSLAHVQAWTHNTAHVLRLPLSLTVQVATLSEVARDKALPVGEIVVWGLQFTPGGLPMFCDALDAVLRVTAARAGGSRGGDGGRDRHARQGGANGGGSGPIRVSFVGHHPGVNDVTVHGGRRVAVSAEEYLRHRSTHWSAQVEYRMLPLRDHREVLHYLLAPAQQGSRVALLVASAWTAEVAHLTSELAILGIPLLIPAASQLTNGLSDSQGLIAGQGGDAPAPGGPTVVAAAGGHRPDAGSHEAEPLFRDDHQRRSVEYQPTAEGLSVRLQGILSEGARCPLLLDDALQRKVPQARRWATAIHGTAALLARHGFVSAAAAGPSLLHPSPPPVTVVVVHHNRPSLLTQAVDAIEAQENATLQLVVVDNGSDLPEVAAVLDFLRKHFIGKPHWQVLTLPPGTSLGAARNAGAARAQGDYLLFMDDDNLARPFLVSTLVRAALATEVDILAPGNEYFAGQALPLDAKAALGRWIPMGQALGVGMYKDCYGDATALIRRDAFVALGGFSTEADSTGEDWELFARATLRGYSLQAVPLPLFWYRRSPGSLSHSTSRAKYRERTLRPYREALPAAMSPALHLARGLTYSKEADEALRRQEAAAIVQLDELVSRLLCGESWLAFHRPHSSGRNMMVNPSFRQVDPHMPQRAQGWAMFGEGYLLSDVCSSAEEKPAVAGASTPPCALHMLSMSTSEVLGASQVVDLHQSLPMPIFVAAHSKAKNVVGESDTRNPHYSLYLDLNYADGTETYGVALKFPLGTHDWMWEKLVLLPAKPVKSAHVLCLFRFHSGEVWFDEVVVRVLTPEEVCDVAAAGASDKQASNTKAGGTAEYSIGTPVLSLG